MPKKGSARTCSLQINRSTGCRLRNLAQTRQTCSCTMNAAVRAVVCIELCACMRAFMRACVRACRAMSNSNEEVQIVI